MDKLLPMIRSLANGLLDLVYPPHCVNCGSPGAWLCQECIDAIPWITYPFCPVCGRPQDSDEICSLCASRPSYVTSARSLAPHTGALREAVHGLKYEGLRALAPTLGDLLARGYRRYGLDVDLIVPVPLHTDRDRQRGYNHAGLLATAMGQRADVPAKASLLVRTRDTASQVGLSGPERWRNVFGAFEATASLANKSVLVIDDVYTTGATLQACGAALLQAGADHVAALSLTRALDREARKREAELSRHL